MALNIIKEIELSSHDINPEPKLVDQLFIVHESSDGELVQYYITHDTHIESDKNTYAVGIPKRDSLGNITSWTYITYEEAVWDNPKGRITRQRIDRLGVKAFPQIGAIAFYKLAYRNLSRIVAPVNFNKNRQFAPTLKATPSTDRTSVVFTMTDPIDPTTGEPLIDYIVYRIIMVVDVHQLEFVTYEKTYTVANVPITATYLCYVIGYINEGEICSYESNPIEVSLNGLYAQWPSCSPGNYAGQRRVISTTLEASGWSGNTIQVSLEGLLLTQQVTLIPPKATDAASQSAVAAFYAAQLSEVSHGDGELTIFAVTPPSNDLPIQIVLS